MHKFALIFLLAFSSAPAFAYNTTLIQLSVQRETIRDSAPLTMATSMTIHVRYDEAGTCYVLGEKQDYPCTVERNFSDREYNFILRMTGDSFLSLLSNELSWDQPEYRAEFLALFYKDFPFYFVSPNYRDPYPENVALHPVAFRNSDGKTTYTIR